MEDGDLSRKTNSQTKDRNFGISFLCFQRGKKGLSEWNLKKVSELVKVHVLRFMVRSQIFSGRTLSPMGLTAPVGVKHGEHSVIRPKSRTAISHGPKINAEADLKWKLYVLLLLPQMLARQKSKLGPGFAHTPEGRGQFEDDVDKVLVELIPAWLTLE